MQTDIGSELISEREIDDEVARLLDEDKAAGRLDGKPHLLRDAARAILGLAMLAEHEVVGGDHVIRDIVNDHVGRIIAYRVRQMSKA